MKKKTTVIGIAIIIILAGILWWQGQKSAIAPTETEQDTLVAAPIYKEIATTSIAYQAETTGYLAEPKGTGPFPALILIHEWWGLNQNIKDLADDFAAQGYVALAVDLYDGQVAETPEMAGQLAGAVRENPDLAFANLEAATTYLQSLEQVDPNSLASVGWCFGGQWAYNMAKNDLGVAASVMYYGRFSAEDDLSMMRADILGHFGEEDTSIAIDDVEQFQAKLQTLNGNHAVYIYPNAGHAFANEDNEEAYNKEAAELAWRRTLDFLKQELSSNN